MAPRRQLASKVARKGPRYIPDPRELTFEADLDILRNGLQKKKTRQDKDSAIRLLPGKDHYERWLAFQKRQYSKAFQVPWAAVEVTERAVVAQRDTPLGIVDTITREYVTRWAPEMMLVHHWLSDDRFDDHEEAVTRYKTWIPDLRFHVFDVLNRIDCGGDNAAEQLSKTLMHDAKSQLDHIFDLLENHLGDDEQYDYDPDRLVVKPTTAVEATSAKPGLVADPAFEARILNSSSVWGTVDAGQPSSNVRDSVAKEMAQLFTTTDQDIHQSSFNQPSNQFSRKRRYSQTASSPEPDPADNGQIWNSLIPDSKRRRLEFKFTDTVKLSSKNGSGRQSRFEVHGRSPQKHDTVDLTIDGSDEENESGGAYGFKEEGFGASSTPSPQSNSDSQCILM